MGVPEPELRQRSYDGASDGVDNGGRAESVLDVETITGMSPGLERITILNGPGATHGDFATSMVFLLSEALDANATGGALTDVVSVSWGACEPKVLEEFANVIPAIESIFQTAAVAGVTVVVASGDQGSSDCVSHAPPYELQGRAVDYPASSPWVTAVGGTNLLLADDNTIEKAGVWNDWPLILEGAIPSVGCDMSPCRPNPVWAGGGGVSSLFKRPPWQAFVNPNDVRVLPDVSFLADVYPAMIKYQDGQWSGAGNGTSQVAPIFASFVLYYNDWAEAKGRPRMGFANPSIYALGNKAPSVFHDVVEGDNIIGDNDARFNVECCSAKPGYDLATGWGSPLLDAVIAAVE